MDEFKECVAATLQDLLFQRELLAHPNPHQLHALLTQAHELSTRLKGSQEQAQEVDRELQGIKESIRGKMEIHRLKAALKACQELPKEDLAGSEDESDDEMVAQPGN